MEINKDIINSAIRCNQNCLCTKESWESCAKVGECVNDLILYLDEPLDQSRMLSCKYYLPFGGEHYCICPARLYIYKEYRI